MNKTKPSPRATRLSLGLPLGLLAGFAMAACGSQPTSEDLDPSQPTRQEGSEQAEQAEPAEPAPAPVTREQAAEAVRAARRDSDAAAARGDHAADAAARIALVEAYAAWAAAVPSEGECMPAEAAEEAPGERPRRARPISNERWMARREAREELSCAEERGGDRERIRALRASFDREEEAATTWCRAHERTPMQGRVGVLRAMGAGSACPSGLALAFGSSRAMERLLGIPSAGGAFGAGAFDGIAAPAPPAPQGTH